MGAVSLVLMGSAFAQDPRVGTLACVVEAAHAFDPHSGESAPWLGSPKSFILSISTCQAAIAGEFPYDFADSCRSYRQDGLVMKTTIPGWEIGWKPSPPSSQVTIKGKTYRDDGGLFDNAITDTAEHRIPARIILSPDLKFDFINGAPAKGDPSMNWWTLSGHCSSFESP